MSPEQNTAADLGGYLQALRIHRGLSEDAAFVEISTVQRRISPERGDIFALGEFKTLEEGNLPQSFLPAAGMDPKDADYNLFLSGVTEAYQLKPEESTLLRELVAQRINEEDLGKYAKLIRKPDLHDRATAAIENLRREVRQRYMPDENPGSNDLN